MYEIRDDPQTFRRMRRKLEEAYALAVDLVLKDHLTIIIGEIRDEGFVKVATLKYCELHVDVTPGEPS